ncbi:MULTISPECIES: hypothetical protein [unclassified Streptomyces]|nr:MULTISPECIES: hypothetical protein [unclassified Streptomyces]MDX2733222.1 hypothetical protein [Streptomyces sp. PA03-2a]MDX3769110.1 hypothetical protein [Streptomyces sp. AK08-01B]MDX3815486.1 hypothetical protein [Streptomyces sp. AK08-01A]
MLSAPWEVLMSALVVIGYDGAGGDGRPHAPVNLVGLVPIAPRPF